MWKSISLSYLEFNDLSKTIHDFINDIDKLRHLQATGHVPLILSQKKESQFHVILAPGTLDVLVKIDALFSKFSDRVIPVMIDFHHIESHDLLMGNKETFKNNLYTDKSELVEELDLV